MKKILKYIVVTALVLGFSACSDEFLEFVPEDQATVNAWYRDAGEIRQATATLYGRPWWNYTDVFQWVVGDLMSGDMYHTWEGEGEFFKNSHGAGNRHILDGWRGIYNGISIANLIINEMPGIAQSNGVSAATIEQALAEARFFRGASYFLLAEYWGDVPILENPSAMVANNNLTPPKNRVQDVYEFARRDLVYAAEHLLPNDEPGRVTTWAAKGMLAKLHLTLAQRGSNADFAIAADYARDVFLNSGRQLAGSYEDLFKVANEHDPEILWALQCINNGWSTGSSRQARFARHIAVTGDGTAWGDEKCPTISFIRNLEANAGNKTDKRRRAIYMQQGDTYDYLATENGGYTYNIVHRDEDNVQLNGASPSLTAVKKHIIGNEADMGFVITNQDSPLDLYMLRLADVYLLLAEAEAGQAGTLTGGDGLTALNMVRERAGLDPRASATYEDIFNERRVELGFEAQGWLEVKRRYYRDPSGTIDYLNNMGRALRYQPRSSDGQVQAAQENDPDGYVLVYSTADATNPVPPPTDGVDVFLGSWPGMGDGNPFSESVASFTESRMTLPIPATESLQNRNLRAEAEAVPYEFE